MEGEKKKDIFALSEKKKNWGARYFKKTRKKQRCFVVQLTGRKKYPAVGLRILVTSCEN